MSGFSFGGVHSSTLGIEVLKISDPLLPPTRDRREDIPGRDGAWDFGADFGARAISINVALTAQAREDLRNTVRQLAARLNPKAGVKALTFDDEPGKSYAARIAGSIPIEHLANAYAEFSISFAAFDPVAFGEPLIWTHLVDTGAFRVNNPGTYETRPVLTITALDGGQPGDVCLTGGYDPDEAVVDTLTNLTLTLGGRTIQYFAEILPGQSLIIDCEKLQASVGGLNAISAIVGDFPVLGPGDNNLAMTDDTSTGGGAVKLEFRGRWL